MQTAAAYIRVSTDDQMEYSPDSQLKLIREYAERSNITLLEEYIFTEEGGISGKSMNKRPEFMRMIALSKKKPKPFDVILLWKFSRFARNMEEAITLKSMLKRNDIDVISISEPIPSGPFGDLIERVIEWSDSYYLVNLGQEVKRGMLERASRGLPVAPPPIGYYAADGRYLPSPDAPLVRAVFEDYLSGTGIRALAVKYSGLGLQTKRGNPVDSRAIEYILRNPVYAGKIRWSTGGKAASARHYKSPDIMIYDGQHEAIVPEELFNAVQARLDNQKHIYGKHQRPEQPLDWMLKGLVRCSACGSTLILINRKNPTLQCHSYGRGSCRVSHSISMAAAEEAVKEYLEKSAVTGSFMLSPKKPPTNPDEPLSAYKKMLENEHAKLRRINAAYQNGIDSLDEYCYNKTKIKHSIARLEAMMKETKPAPVDRIEYSKRITSVLNILNDPNQPPAAKNLALRSIIKKIVYNKPLHSFEVYFY